MIQAIVVMNTHGKPRITKFYKNVIKLHIWLGDFGLWLTLADDCLVVGKAADEQQEIISAIYSALSSKGENTCSFIEADDIFGPDTQLVYKHFATLYFVFVIDQAENELAILDLIQLFVEVLDKAFKNVCELDIVYNFNKGRGLVRRGLVYPCDCIHPAISADQTHFRLAGNQPISELEL